MAKHLLRSKEFRKLQWLRRRHGSWTHPKEIDIATSCGNGGKDVLHFASSLIELGIFLKLSHFTVFLYFSFVLEEKNVCIYILPVYKFLFTMISFVTYLRGKNKLWVSTSQVSQVTILNKNVSTHT